MIHLIWPSIKQYTPRSPETLMVGGDKKRLDTRVELMYNTEGKTLWTNVR